jgi:hypothetical protein
VTEKACFKCGEVMPPSEFYAHPMMKDKHLGKCKGCTKKDATNHRDNNLDKIRKYDRERFKDPDRKKMIKVYMKRMRDKSRDKFIARSRLAYALRTGKIERGTCRVCGDKKVQAHHTDYSKPLEVMWLCSPHHWDQHRREELKSKGIPPCD